MEFTKEFEQIICDTYLKLGTVSAVSRELKISRGPIAVLLQARKLRIKPEGREIVDKVTESKVCYDYEHTILTEDLIAEKYNLCKQSVRNIWKRNGVLARDRLKYKCNHLIKCDDSYFEKINNPERAWVLGFIAGDGSIVIDFKENENEFIFEILGYDNKFAVNKTSPFLKIWLLKILDSIDKEQK